MFNDLAPSKLNSWNGAWNAKVSGGTGSVKKRIIKSDVKIASSNWKKIRSSINNPMVEKEVWIFLGNILSKKYFESELAKNNPIPNAIQAAYLLNATMSDVASVGAKLKIFCKE